MPQNKFLPNVVELIVNFIISQAEPILRISRTKNTNSYVLFNNLNISGESGNIFKYFLNCYFSLTFIFQAPKNGIIPYLHGKSSY